MFLRRIVTAITASTMVAISACGNAQAPSATLEDLQAEAPVGRLPEGVAPAAYRLYLVLDPRKDAFSGNVEIDVSLEFPTDRIWLHGRDLTVSKVAARSGVSESVTGKYLQVLDTGVSALVFDEQLTAGNWTFHLEYSASFNQNLAGLFKVEEQGQAYALAKSESIQARNFLPGFDEPGLKATFDIALTIPDTHVAISNGAELSRQAAGDGMDTVKFATTRPMSTYLLSISAGPFDVVERPAIPSNSVRSTPIPLRGFARKDRGGDMNYVLDITPEMMRIFEEALQQPYPFAKLDIVAAPQWPSGATELSAAITYREQRILVGDDPAPGARLSLISVHAHEIAHMWFGNLVTPPWWDDLWLKEGFATWGTRLALTELEPDGGHELNSAVEAISAMHLDSLASTRAIREDIADNNNVRNAYDAITYDKSLGLIHMADSYFGADIFRPALGRYIASFVDGAADSPDFYRVIARETETPALTETFRSFVEQKGVPLIEVALDCQPGKAASATIAQSRYRPLGSSIQASGQRWSVPVCLRSDQGKQCVILSEPEEQVALHGGQCPAWLMPNSGGSGYYRWNMAPEDWQALLRNFSELEAVEQISAIDSAFAGFEAGHVEPATVIEISRLAALAPERQVITAPLPYLAKYERRYFTDADSAALLAYARSLYLPVLERTRSSTVAEDQLLRSVLLGFMARSAKDPEIRKQLLDRAHAFTGFEVERIGNALDSDLYVDALTVAVQDSPPMYLEALLELRQTVDDPLLENASATAIGRVNNPELLDSLHQVALSDAMGPRESFSLLLQAMGTDNVSDAHWNWLTENFAAVVAEIPEQWRRQMPLMARSFCDRDKLREARQLFDKHADLIAGYERSLDQVSEGIELCIALRDHATGLSAVLRDPR